MLSIPAIGPPGHPVLFPEKENQTGHFTYLHTIPHASYSSSVRHHRLRERRRVWRHLRRQTREEVSTGTNGTSEGSIGAVAQLQKYRINLPCPSMNLNVALNSRLSRIMTQSMTLALNSWRETVVS
jgi:hypothetical protein